MNRFSSDCGQYGDDQDDESAYAIEEMLSQVVRIRNAIKGMKAETMEDVAGEMA